MKRRDLEHLIRAAAEIADDEEIIVIGSQAILGQFPQPPEALCVSAEADLFPKNKPERADLIDGSIGEGSPFHETFGYYAKGVSEETALLPAGWRERLVPIRNRNTRGTTGWCLEIHDLLLAKYSAGREKDAHFIRAAIQASLADQAILIARSRSMPLSEARIANIQQQIQADFARPESES